VAMVIRLPLLNCSSPRKDVAKRPLGTALEFGVLLASYKVTSPHTIHPDTSFPALVRFANERGIELAPSLQRAFRSQPKRAVSPTMEYGGRSSAPRESKQLWDGSSPANGGQFTLHLFADTHALEAEARETSIR